MTMGVVGFWVVVFLAAALGPPLVRTAETFRMLRKPGGRADDWAEARLIALGSDSVHPAADSFFRLTNLSSAGFTALGTVTDTNVGPSGYVGHIWVDDETHTLVAVAVIHQPVGGRSYRYQMWFLSFDVSRDVATRWVEVTSTDNWLEAPSPSRAECVMLPGVRGVRMLELHRQQRALLCSPRRVDSLIDALDALHEAMADGRRSWLEDGVFEQLPDGRLRLCRRVALTTVLQVTKPGTPANRWWLDRKQAAARQRWSDAARMKSRQPALR